MSAKLLLLSFWAILGQVWCKEALVTKCPSYPVYIPHEEQLSFYFACLNGEATLLKCDLNKVFDVHAQKCISEGLSSRTNQLGGNRCMNLKDNDILPHENNCNLYYICKSGESVLQNCPDDLSFGFEEKVCVWTAPGCIGSRDGHIGIKQTPGDPTDLTDFGDYANGCPRNHHIHRLLPHEYNCQKFYYCVHERRSVARICPSILVFDNKLQVCVWPWDTDCSNQNGGSSENASSNEASPSPGPGSSPGSPPEEFGPNGCPRNFYGSYHLPYPYDCGKFYTCVHGEKIVEKCFDGLHFDFDKQSCVWPWEANCGGGIDGEGDAGSTSVEEPGSGCGPDNGDGGNNGEEGAGGSSGETPGETIENGCPVNDDVTYLQPHEDCSKFYSCVRGKKIVQNCPPDLFFNYKKQACVWPWESDCEGNVGGGDTETGNSDGDNSNGNESDGPPDASAHESGPGVDSNENNESSIEQPGCGHEPDNGDESNSGEEGIGGSSGETPPCIGPGEIYENGCPRNHDVTYFQPHEDCTKFYSCVFGDKVVQNCPSGLFFSYKQQKCVWRWESDCIGNGGPSHSDETVSSESSEGQEPSVSSEETGGSGSESGSGSGSDSECRDIVNGLYLIPHESDCSQFYACVGGKKVQQKCYKGLKFSYEHQACVWPWESKCEDSISGGNNPGDSNESNISSSEHSGSSSETDNGTDDNCGEQGTGGSSGENLPGTNPGGNYENGCPVNHDITYLQPHEDCTKFYSCVHGEKVIQHCPPDLLFNYKQQDCVWSWESDCVGTDGSSGSEENKDSESTEEQKPPVSSEETDGSSSESSSGGGNVSECPKAVDGSYLIPHENDCSLFYGCVGGTKIQQNCYTGLKFSYKYQACVWPWESECEDSIGGGNNPEGSNENNGSSNEYPGSSSEIDNSSEEDNGEQGTGNSSNEGISGTNPGGTYDNGCPVNHDITYLQPHEDCTKFYSCVNGKKIVQDCPSVLFFNYKQQACVWSWESDCIGAGSSSSSDETDASESTEAKEPTVSSEETEGCGTESGSGDGNLNECPQVDNGLYLIPHETDCSLFYACVGGEKIQQNCYTGLKFSYKHQACVWPWESDCVGAGSSSGSDESNASESVEVEEPSVSSEENNNSGSEPGSGGGNVNGCPAVVNGLYLIPHETDCSLFYACVGGERIKQNCYTGLKFSYEHQACVWPWESDCISVGGSSSSDENNAPESTEVEGPSVSSEENVSSGSESGSGGGNMNECPAVVNGSYLIPHETDCSLFYACVGGERIKQNCYTGLKFSYEHQACVWPWESDCVAAGGSSDSDESNASESAEIQKPPVSSEENGSYDSEPGNGGGNINECPAVVNGLYLIPHGTDCSLFYACVGGEKIQQNCFTGLKFSYKHQACIWPWESDCIGAGSSSGSDESNASESVEVEEPSVSSEENNNSGSEPGSGGGNVNGCPAVVNGLYLIPHETDCSLFYACVGGERIKQNCYKGLKFSYKHQACVWPWESDCVGAGGSSSSDENNAPESTEVEGPSVSSEENVSSGSESGSGGGNINECPAVVNGLYLIPHETDCSLFYACVGGERIKQNCYTGLKFSYEHQACVWPWESDCVATGGSSGSDESNASESAEIQKPPVSSEENVSSGSESGSGGGNIKECPAVVNGLYLIPHETDCSLFYACVGGEKIQQNCYTGLKFSYKHQACVWPWESDCVSAGSSSGSDESNASESVEVEEPSVSSEENNSSGSEPGSGGGNVNECPAVVNGLYLIPHETDCSLFYACVGGERIKQNCYTGLKFSYEHQACVWPWESDCVGAGGSSSSDESNAPKSTEVEGPSVSSEENVSSGSESGSGGGNIKECPAVVNGLYLIPHETDCSLFYACVGGERIKQNCYAGLKFSYEHQACIWPWESNCVAAGGSSGSDESNASGSAEVQKPPVSSEENGSYDSEPGNGGGNVNECPVVVSGLYLIPHETDCFLFYACVGGEKTQQNCYNGLKFSYRHQSCVWPSDSDCQTAGPLAPQIPEGSTEEGEVKESAEEKHPVGPGITDEVCKTIVDGRYNLPYENGCTRFYSCIGGQLKVQNCPGGTYFSYMLQHCVWPWESECRNEH